MLALFLPSRVYLRVRLVGLLCLFLAVLGVHRCTQNAPAPPSCTVSAPARESGRALLPVAFRMPFPSGRWLRVLDTSRAGGAAHLLRKATPRSRWLPAQPAYLPQLHRRPKQSFLDSVARSSFRRI